MQYSKRGTMLDEYVEAVAARWRSTDHFFAEHWWQICFPVKELVLGPVYKQVG